jgi:prepilin peptidase CpaA
MELSALGPFFALFIFPGLMIAAAICDIATLTIPNRLSLALLLLFVPAALVAHLSAGAIGWHTLIGVIALGFGILAFALRWMGGGDSKFFAATALWFGPQDILSFAVTVSIVGGMLAVLLMSFRRIPLPALLARQDWIQKLWTEGTGVPYALAFAGGALFVYPEAEIFHRLMAA